MSNIEKGEIPVRVGESLDAAHTIKTLKDQLKELEKNAGAWVLTEKRELYKDGDGYGVKLTFAKPNGDGFITTISASEVEYFQNDVDSLALNLVDEIINNLYQNQIREAITPVVALAVRNAMTMKTKT